MHDEDLSKSARAALDHLASLYDEEFVGAAYRIVLGRQADPGGFRNYLAQIRGGIDRMQIIAEMALSPEGRGVTPHGLFEVIKPNLGRRPTLWNRFLGRAKNRQILELERQVRMLDNHLYLVERAITKRLEEVHDAVRVAQPAAVLPVQQNSVPPKPPQQRRQSGIRLSPGLSKTFAELSDAIAASR